MDKVTLAGFRLFTHVGCTPEERLVGQHLAFDVVAEGDFRAAGERDDIALSVDYAQAFAAVRDAVVGKDAKLLETVAERAAAAVLAFPRVRRVTVRVRKEAPPFPHGHAAHAEVEIVRDRGGGLGEPEVRVHRAERGADTPAGASSPPASSRSAGSKR